MFFSETIKRWQETRAMEKEVALFEEKEKARVDTITTALFGFIFGVAGTSLLSGILYMMIHVNNQMLDGSGETMSTSLTLLIGYNLPIYFLLLLGIMKVLYMTLNSLWIFVRVIFVKTKYYDLENEPSFRI